MKLMELKVRLSAKSKGLWFCLNVNQIIFVDLLHFMKHLFEEHLGTFDVELKSQATKSDYFVHISDGN